MIFHFVDTSSFLKLFVMEVGSPAMTRFSTSEPDEQKLVSALTRVEARSALSRLFRNGDLTLIEADLAMDLVDRDLRRMRVCAIDRPVLDSAGTLVREYRLRALDAVQLASAIVFQDTLRSEVRFISSDKGLLSAAEAEGFPIWDPTI